MPTHKAPVMPAENSKEIQISKNSLIWLWEYQNIFCKKCFPFKHKNWKIRQFGNSEILETHREFAFQCFPWCVKEMLFVV